MTILLSAVLIAHFVGDFILQTDSMAMNKSTNNRWLLAHIGAYTLMLLVFGPVYAATNGLIHAAVDYNTSRWTSRLWKSGNRHGFFVVIGLDQLIHALVLVWTLPLVWG